MKNRVPLRQQKPFGYLEVEKPKEESKPPDFVVQVAQKKSVSQNLTNKSFTMALKKSWQTGAFSLLNQELQCFPEELFNIDEINLDGEQWWNKNPLTKIDLSNNRIVEIPPLSNLLDIQVLRLDSNAITTLPANLFETLPNLKSLSLMKNNLQHFPHYWAPHLVELVLSENKLAEFLPSPNINQNFLSLEILDLRQNQLQQAPFISSALKLKRITLQQNRIQALHSAQFALCGVMEDVLCAKNIIEHIETGFFARMPNLKIIDLKENRLREFTQEHIGDTHPALDQIMLAYNQLTNYTAYVGLPQLSILLLNNNKINVLSNQVIQLKGLRTLDVSNNDLSDLPSEMALLPLLVRIQLEGNPLKCIRPQIRQAGAEVLKKYLKSRIQNEDDIKVLEKQLNPKQNIYKECSQWEEVFRNFLHKDELIARDQKLLQYDPLLFQQTQLRVLDLSQNQLGDLPPQIVQCKQLQRIALNNAKLSQFPFMLEQLPYLVDLEFSQNQIQSLEVAVQGFQAVRHINLSMNKIKQIPKWIAGLSSLRVLNMAYNQLRSIDQLLERPINLEVLDVSNNSIAAISDDIYYSLPNLNHLNLANNNLSSIPTIIGFIRLTTIQIEGNPTKAINHTILQKGTVAIMEYLRTKHPVNMVPQPRGAIVPEQTQQQQQFPQSQPNFPTQQTQQQYQQPQTQPLKPSIDVEQARRDIDQLNREISMLEIQIAEDFTLNKFQKQDKRKLLQQRMLQRNSIQSQL